MDGSVAASGAWRDYHCALRGRCHPRLPAPGRGRALPQGTAGASARVWAGAERRQDTANPIRAVCETEPGRAWRGKTGSVHLPGTPAHLREEQAGQVRSPAHYGRQTKAEETAGIEAGTPAEDARADCQGRRMAAERV